MADQSMPASVIRLAVDRAEEVVDVLADAFHDYPVMRYVVGPVGDAYDRRLRMLVSFFVLNRAWRHEPMIGIEDTGRLVAAATMTPPGDRPLPAEAATVREQLWGELSGDARSRYEALGTVWRRFAVVTPHLHLNMIGVRHAAMGRGHARVLLEAVHTMSEADPGSAGVSLTTEHSDNVALYRYFGYAVTGHAQVAPEIETWSFFRPRASTP